MPIIPFGYQVRPDSTITLVPVKQPVVDYYRDLWMHRLNAGRAGAGYPLLVLVDGMVAGIVHYSPTSMTRSHVYGKGGERWARHIILSFAYGAPHESLRLGRLVTAIALQRPTAAVAFGNTGQGPIWLAASLGLVTSEMTRHPEAKGLRGLMELVHRDKHQDGYKLVYEAAWSDTPLPEVVADFVKKELRWQQNRQKQRANAGA